MKYDSAEKCVGGPVDGDIKGSGLGEGYGVKGGKAVGPLHKGKGGGLPQAKTAKKLPDGPKGKLTMGNTPRVRVVKK